MALTFNGSTNTITGLAVGGLPDGIVDTDMIAAAAVTAPKRGAGSQLQVVSTAKTDVWTDSSQSWVDVTGFSLNITPASTSNKILILLDAKVSQGTVNKELFLKIVRTISSTAADVYVGDAASNRTRCTYGFEDADHSTAPYEMKQVHATFLDSPNTTSQINYKIQMRVGNNGGNAYLNRTGNDGDSANFPRCASSITALEVAG